MRYRHDETPGVRGAAASVASVLAVVVLLAPSLSGAGQETEIAEARASFEAPLGQGRSASEALAWQRGATDDERAILSYQVETRPGDWGFLDVELIQNGEGAWRVAELQEADEVVLEDFEAGPVGGLPEGWTWKGSDGKKEKPYTVVEEGGNRFLQARDSGQSVILGKDIRWDLDTYPYVSFRLRVHRIPEGADERNDKTVDSAAGIYFTYRRRFGQIPESVKYVWSSTLPVGAAVIRPGTGRPWQVVVGSGTNGFGEWRTYVFDLRQAYRDTFGKNPPDKTVGIGVLSDANSVGGYAWADYDDIKALRSVDGVVGSGVAQIMKHTR